MKEDSIDILITFLNDAGEALEKDEDLNKHENPFYIARNTIIRLILENRVLKERLQHLLKSKIVRRYDSKDERTGQYKLDIDEFDERYSKKKGVKITIPKKEYRYLKWIEKDYMFRCSVSNSVLKKQYYISKDLLIEKINVCKKHNYEIQDFINESDKLLSD